MLTCDSANVSYVTVTNFDNTLSYILVDGDDNDTEYAINDSGVFANVVPGTYTVRVENNDCNASSETATVSPNAGDSWMLQPSQLLMLIVKVLTELSK